MGVVVVSRIKKRPGLVAFRVFSHKRSTAEDFALPSLFIWAEKKIRQERNFDLDWYLLGVKKFQATPTKLLRGSFQNCRPADLFVWESPMGGLAISLAIH